MQEIRSIAELLAWLPEVERKAGRSYTPPWYNDHENLWFRGQASAGWVLEPQVLRTDFACRAKDSEPHVVDSSFSFEASLLAQLRRRGHYLFPQGESLHNIYLLAQHYGLPTRLLDWTTNPLVALFFAVAERQGDDGAVFKMRSRFEISDEEGRGVLYQDAPLVTQVLESLFRCDYMPELSHGVPLRIMPDIQGGRMFQQDSRFTLHHPGCRSLDQGVPAALVEKVTIAANAKSRIQEELRQFGVHWGTLFPDLGGLVRQIRTEAMV